MSYKDLLVHIDDTRGCPRRIDAAIRLASSHGAHLDGVYVTPEPQISGYVGLYLTPEIMATVAQEAGARADRALADFREAAERAGIAFGTRIERGPDPDMPDLIGLHARYADLVILGQVDDEDPASRHPNLPERVVLGSGRPVLVVPYIGAGPTIGERVTIAWDASREAARAVSDAMPLLEMARSVAVVSVNPRSGPSGHGEEPGADIGAHLARHGVKVEVHRLEARDIDTANVILSHLADAGSDLLVMGCYGHSRLRETVLGGVTRTILHDMTVPVLMAH